MCTWQKLAPMELPLAKTLSSTVMLICVNTCLLHSACVQNGESCVTCNSRKQEHKSATGRNPHKQQWKWYISPLSHVKVKLTAFFNVETIVYLQFVLQGWIVNSALLGEELQCLVDAICWKRLEKWWHNWRLHHNKTKHLPHISLQPFGFDKQKHFHVTAASIFPWPVTTELPAVSGEFLQVWTWQSVLWPKLQCPTSEHNTFSRAAPAMWCFLTVIQIYPNSKVQWEERNLTQLKTQLPTKHTTCRWFQKKFRKFLTVTSTKEQVNVLQRSLLKKISNKEISW